MEQNTDIPHAATIDISAVELHRPPDELIQELEATAARYERSFLTPELHEPSQVPPERMRRALGWRALP